MSKYYAIDPKTGEYADIIWRRHPAAKKHDQFKDWYMMYLDDRLVAQIYKESNVGLTWGAISHDAPHMSWLGKGFATRWAATEFILRVGGSWPKE